MNEKCDHYIDGHWRQGHGCTMFSVNPADNSIIWQGRCAPPDEIKDAYEAARRASYEWSMLDFNIRANYLTAFAKKVSDCRDELARIISIDSGKPLWESRTEVTAVINKIQISIAAHIQRLAETNVTISAGITNNLRYKAHGVVAVLGPFNFPAHISNGHIVPALLAGNTIIYKPSELTPMVAAFIMQCWHDSGLPAGVINCVQGGGVVAKTLLENFSSVKNWNKEEILNSMKETLNKHKVKGSLLYKIVTGFDSGLPLPESLEILGKEKTLERIRKASK